RVKIDPDQSALTFMRQTVKVLKKIYRHQRYPYDLLVQDLQNESVELSEMLEYVFSYENISYQLKNEWHFSGHEFFPFVIHVTEREGASRLKFEIDFREESYSQDEIKRWMKSYTQLLTSVLSDPSQALKNINLLTTDDIDFFINTLNNTSTDYPKQEPIQLIFEQQVMNYADRTALVFQDTLFSYRDLNRKANQLARVIQSCGFKDGLCVGLIADRTPDMIISILAILKAGGTYVPINPDYPENRMEYMFKDSDIRIVVIDKKYFEKISFYKGEIIYLGDNDLYTGDDRNLDIKMSFDDVAVIVYTSGSTGNPKGNLVTHRNIIRVVKKTNYVDICENDILLQLSNYAFDGSFFDIFGSLLNGARLVLIDAVSMLNIKKLAAFIEDHNISMFFVTTAMFNTIVDVNVQCLGNLNKLFFGGERVSFSHVRKALNSLGEDKLVHVYGPTESTVFATYYPINALDENLGTVPIGKPIANTKVYVLDLHLNPLPPGVIGELYIGGDGLVKGYLNLPELSGDKFLESPFTPGARLYRTGDYVRLLEDGNIEFIGRTDHQIKRRGFRVELGEVESVIAGHPYINKTIVVYNDDDENNMYLCAYYVADEVITSSTMKSYLLELMPSYAIPDYFIQLDQLPINANGKIDLRSLPLPETDSGDTICNDEFSLTDTQKTLVSIWKDVLSRSYVGLHDGFFELGGNSLKLIVMQSDIDEKFPGIVEVGDLFAYPTIERLSHFIESQEAAATAENEIKTINIPSEFFVSGSEINPDDIISWQLDPDIYPVLNKLLDQWNIDLIDVFLSKYVYLFSLISEDQEITVHVQANEGMATFPVTISVAEIDEWSDLFMTVKAV
ncbi:MAG: amino acid adenylation domain-containing protein, partial [Simkaniaceae bacterium]|nr:amino acid adenylation domain-containing protein [Simkaniaceae bacterium]